MERAENDRSKKERMSKSLKTPESVRTNHPMYRHTMRNI